MPQTAAVGSKWLASRCFCDDLPHELARGHEAQQRADEQIDGNACVGRLHLGNPRLARSKQTRHLTLSEAALDAQAAQTRCKAELELDEGSFLGTQLEKGGGVADPPASTFQSVAPTGSRLWTFAPGCVAACTAVGHMRAESVRHMAWGHLVWALGETEARPVALIGTKAPLVGMKGDALPDT